MNNKEIDSYFQSKDSFNYKSKKIRVKDGKLRALCAVFKAINKSQIRIQPKENSVHSITPMKYVSSHCYA